LAAPAAWQPEFRSGGKLHGWSAARGAPGRDSQVPLRLKHPWFPASVTLAGFRAPFFGGSHTAQPVHRITQLVQRSHGASIALRRSFIGLRKSSNARADGSLTCADRSLVYADRPSDCAEHSKPARSVHWSAQGVHRSHGRLKSRREGGALGRRRQANRNLPSHCASGPSRTGGRAATAIAILTLTEAKRSERMLNILRLGRNGPPGTRNGLCIHRNVLSIRRTGSYRSFNRQSFGFALAGKILREIAVRRADVCCPRFLLFSTRCSPSSVAA